MEFDILVLLYTTYLLLSDMQKLLTLPRQLNIRTTDRTKIAKKISQKPSFFVVDSLGPLVTVVADQYTPGILVKRKPQIPIAICNLVKKFPGGQLNAHLP